VHHIAFRAVDGAAQAAMADAWRAQGLTVTSIRDRSYFQSVYAREPSGVLLEIATDGPGFLIDETLSTLGSRLQLPEALEPMRADIERLLPPID
jgi:glyoxalase family protein